jgi:uncharacterized membrane protein
MGVQCESCGKITDDENSVFCPSCGSRYNKTELDALKNIQFFLKESQKKIENNSKIQTRISYTSLVISVGALFIALGALLIVALTLPPNQEYVGIVTIIIVVIIVFWFFRKYGSV